MVLELIKENWILSILSTLVLGALGSGLWEIAFKPLFRKIGEVIFNVLTFGVKKIRNSVYLDSAKMHREQGGVFLARHVSLALSAFLIMLVIFYARVTNDEVGLLYSVDHCHAYEEVQQIQDCKRQAAKEHLKQVAPFYIPICIFAAIILLYTSLKLERVYRITTDFNQYLTICKPYISREELLSIERDFALMKDNNDYKTLLEKLLVIAQRHGHQLPRYKAKQ